MIAVIVPISKWTIVPPGTPLVGSIFESDNGLINVHGTILKSSFVAKGDSNAKVCILNCGIAVLVCLPNFAGLQALVAPLAMTAAIVKVLCIDEALVVEQERVDSFLCSML